MYFIDGIWPTSSPATEIVSSWSDSSSNSDALAWAGAWDEHNLFGYQAMLRGVAMALRVGVAVMRGTRPEEVTERKAEGKKRNIVFWVVEGVKDDEWNERGELWAIDTHANRKDSDSL
jgi:hypothetical protein